MRIVPALLILNSRLVRGERPGSRQIPARAGWKSRIPQHDRGRRRGVSMILVNVSISACLVITYAFVQTQNVSMTVNQNMLRRDLAAQAAQTGAAAALQTMQSPTWSGVGTGLSSVIQSDNDGTTSYSVQFLPYQPAAGETATPDKALVVRIESTGLWQSATTSTLTATRNVEVVAQLQPRIPGRTVGPSDYAAAEDLTANPGGYDAIQTYAMYAKGGSSSLAIDPGARVEGNLFLKQNLLIYNTPLWNSPTRNRVLQDLGQRFVTNSNGVLTVQHPHPIGGRLTYYQDPNNKSELSSIGIPWSISSTLPTYPAINFSGWQQYQLYAGGFTYSAQTVSSSLQNVTLRPTAQNPLGVFYCQSSVTINNDVTLQGTLVSNGTVTINGDRVQLTSFNWRGTGGAPLVSNVDLWPRTPAIVASRVTFGSGASAIVEGAVVNQEVFTGTAGRFEYPNVNDVYISGTATSAPAQQPWSTVQLNSNSGLSQLTTDGSYSIWLQRGASGNWYPITGVNSTTGQLTVVGEVRNDSATSFQIGRTRQQYFDVRGPIAADTYDINPVQDWIMTSTQWNDRYNTNWDHNYYFTQWLSYWWNWWQWSYPYSTYGLTLEPTVHCRNTPDNGRPATYYLWAPPLFTAYQGTGAGQPYSGYLWNVLSWRELN